MEVGDKDEEDYSNEDSSYDCVADIIAFLCCCVSKIVVRCFSAEEDRLQRWERGIERTFDHQKLLLSLVSSSSELSKPNCLFMCCDGAIVMNGKR